MTLERLIADGRIHPALIEETYEHVRDEIDDRIAEEGERAALEARVNGLDPELLRAARPARASAPATARTSSTTWSSARSSRR